MLDIGEKVILKLKKRDEKAFDIVYDTYYKLIYFIAYDILKDQYAAEDIMQETFIKLMENIEDYNHKGSFKQYLTTIARNLSLNELKKRNTHEELSLDEDISSSTEHSNLNVLLTLDNNLEKLESEIVKYKVLYDYSFQEIADTLNLSIGKVQSQYYLAIKKLKHYFEKEEGL